MENSDSAEEVAWAPRQASSDAAVSRAAATLPANMRQETSAAVNLLTMSFKDDKDFGAHHTGSATPPPTQLQGLPQSDAAVLRRDPHVRVQARPQHLPSSCRSSL